MPQLKPGQDRPEPVVVPPRQTGGEQTAPPDSLMGRYLLWREQQAAKAATAPTAEEIERLAHKKSRKRLRKLLAGGVSPATATIRAHEHYRSKGGRSTLQVWARRVAEGK